MDHGKCSEGKSNGPQSDEKVMVWELNWQIASQLWKCQKGFIETRKNNLKMSDIISRLTPAGHQENIAVSMHRDTIPMMMDRG